MDANNYVDTSQFLIACSAILIFDFTPLHYICNTTYVLHMEALSPSFHIYTVTALKPW